MMDDKQDTAWKLWSLSLKWQNRKRTIEGNLWQFSQGKAVFETSDEKVTWFEVMQNSMRILHMMYIWYLHKSFRQDLGNSSAQIHLALLLNSFLTVRPPLRLQHIINVSSNFPSLIKNIYSVWTKAKTFKKIRLLWYEHVRFIADLHLA